MVYKRGRMSPGVQIKRVKSPSPSEMRVCILIVVHLKVMLEEAADRQTDKQAAVAASALPWAYLGLPYRPASFLQGDNPTPQRRDK